MNIRNLFSNIVCGFIPGRARRNLVRVRLRYNTRQYVKFVRSYFNDSKIPLTTCVGWGCQNFIVLAGGRYAFKFPLLDNGRERAERERDITDALRKKITMKIPQMQILDFNGLAVRKYEFFPGVTLDQIPRSAYLANRYHIANQIARFIYQTGIADPVSIRKYKSVPTQAPSFMHGWFHNDIGGNFILNPETMDIVGFIDWECVGFNDFSVGLYTASHYWDKLGFRGMVVDVMREYTRLYYSSEDKKLS